MQIDVDQEDLLQQLFRETHDGRIEYLIHDPLIEAYGITKLSETTTLEEKPIYAVLAAASNFFYNLHRAPSSDARLEDGCFKIEMHELGADLSGRPNHQYNWKRDGGENLIRQDGVAELEVDGKRLYGFTVENRSEKPLYVWAFYFDCSTLSISAYSTLRLSLKFC